MTLHVIEHPLVAHYLTRLRDRDTTPDEFREASDKIITLLLYEATRDLRTRDISIDTPLEKTQGHAIGDRVVAVPILRAGLGLVGPVLELLPHVTVGYIGLERDERTAIASSVPDRQRSNSRSNSFATRPGRCQRDPPATGGVPEQPAILRHDVSYCLRRRRRRLAILGRCRRMARGHSSRRNCRLRPRRPGIAGASVRVSTDAAGVHA